MHTGDSAIIGKREVEVIKLLVQHGKDESITGYLQALLVKPAVRVVQLQGELNTAAERNEKEVVRLQGELNTAAERSDKEVVRLQGELNTAVARLQGELNTAAERSDKEIVRLTAELQRTTSQYLNLRGLLNMRGVMEYIQETMSIRHNVTWKKYDAVSSWQAYLDKRPSLKQCLGKCNVDIATAPQALSGMYATLSGAIHNSHAPEGYKQAGLTLYIGYPLEDWRQCALMACLCQDANIPYEFRGDVH
ncbi:hypothetical protein HXX76_004762 [Chlamydomonas incerta]|uniref:Uncharacterized protein n=1 Tax=Chlamydomonas incerta TaxID=51695 RepID=A0A835W4U1_CHLIN|nr:hypothetical protein HXX76_004762 [Chlamydomonas incerta]|eukprot:KAG2439405.1 hypothetical protein HXX76_004762 [Chlamydomonas incerta]